MDQQGPFVRISREPQIRKRIPGRKPHFPQAISYQDQRDKLAPSFEKINRSLAAYLDGGEVARAPEFATPDRALVFEIIGPITDFYKAASRLGFDWLCEELDDSSADDDLDSEYLDEGVATTLYITMPTIGGLQKLLALWNRFVRGEAKTAENRDWWAIFGYLADVRVWAAIDRVDHATRSYIDRIISEYPDRPVRLELDLWFRHDSDLRASAKPYLDALLNEVRGEMLDFVTIEEIGYQAALVQIPVSEARSLSGLSGPVAEADRVMRVRPQSVVRVSPGERDDVARPSAGVEYLDVSRAPIVALLDGYPVQNHELLTGRIDIEEVDVVGEDVPVEKRFHGTSMASLIIHGDLDQQGAPISRPLKVVPILGAPQELHEESTHPDRLPVGLVYRAVLALVVGVDGASPLEERTVLINHSICDVEGPFIRRPSPWARAIDFLSFKYRLLFVVSAGNIRFPFPLDTYSTADEFMLAPHDERQVVILRSLEKAKGIRSILSPAESINSLTVGALHLDETLRGQAGHVDPFDSIGLTNLCSAVGLGINRSIKPDIVEAGGKQVALAEEEGGVVSIWGGDAPHSGQLSASADPYSGTVTRLARSSGTSNAAALTTRSGVKIAEVLEDLFLNDGQDWNQQPTRAVTLKALMTHGCAWREVGDVLDAIYPPQGQYRWARRREAISRFLGFGKSNVDRVTDQHGSRVTLLADDVIAPGALHRYLIPIPRAMIGNRELRRVVMTLTWSTPVDFASAKYRGIALDLVDGDGKRAFWRGIDKVTQPSHDAGRRGTLQHMILEGQKLISDAESGAFAVCVQARSLQKRFDQVPVPYALAVTLEMAQPVRDTVYADVRARVRPKTEVAIPNRVPANVRT